MAAIIYVIVGFIEFVLVFRLAFRLLGANPNNGFVSWVYDISSPLIAPFVGIFGQPPIVEGTATTGVFELATIIAIIVYGIIGGIIVRLFAGMSRRGVER